MSNQIFNTASLTFKFGSQTGCAFSNTASANLLENLTMNVNSLGSTYFWGTTVTYIVNIKNNSNFESKNLKITHNLTSSSSDKNLSDTCFVPLEYISPSFLYIDGIFNSEISPEINPNKIIFEIASISKNSTITIIYKLIVNQYAPIDPDSTLVNEISLVYDGMKDTVASQINLTPEKKADVKVIKSMSPSNISAGEEITYDFFLYNYGNTVASNVILTDNFSPAPNITSIKSENQELIFSDYSYLNGTLSIPSYNSSFNLAIPAAKFSKNPETSLISANPGVVHIEVKGKI